MTQGIAAMEGFTFGCDPELFVMDGDGNFVTAEGLIPGTKADPYAVQGGAVQVDGMAAEFNIDPVSNFEDFDKNIMTVMSSLKKMLPTGYKLVPVPAAVFSKEEWAKAPDHAKELGCSPDYNAWTGEVNPPPSCPDNPRLRTASGHIHVGWTSGESIANLEHLKHCTDLVKQMDWFLGAWSTRLDSDNTRRLLYGKAGACRIKDYGVEYRVLSNFWLTDKRRRLAVWNRTMMAIHEMREGFMPEKTLAKAAKTGFDFNDAVVRSINTGEMDGTLAATYRFPTLVM